ncbi:MAG TPA: carbohydrate ABC transporter permease, partial [Conexibacter sp.]|nr:carbohydrate ABC transporter permease [Conexibacter sp.]
AISVLPLLWTLSSAFKVEADIFASPPSLLPNPFTLDGFRNVFDQYPVARWTFNSLLISGVATALGVLVSAMAGYAFATYDFRGRDALFGVVMLALIIPFIALVVPLYVVVSRMGLVNTYAGVILPQVAQPFGIFLMRQFTLQTVPDQVLQAARLDGASEFRIFFRIVLPLLRPGIAALGVWLFLLTYNNFLWPLMVLTDAAHQTLPVGLASLANSVGTQQQYSLLMAGAVTAALPALLVFAALRKQFVRSLTRGALAN